MKHDYDVTMPRDDWVRYVWLKGSKVSKVVRENHIELEVIKINKEKRILKLV